MLYNKSYLFVILNVKSKCLVKLYRKFHIIIDEVYDLKFVHLKGNEAWHYCQYSVLYTTVYFFMLSEGAVG